MQNGINTVNNDKNIMKSDEKNVCVCVGARARVRACECVTYMYIILHTSKLMQSCRSCTVLQNVMLNVDVRAFVCVCKHVCMCLCVGMCV